MNVIAYYSSEIFLSAGFSQIAALSASLGFGVINWLFAIPAIYTIDTFGRRNLLLVTFPLMALFQLMTGFAFWIPAKTPASSAASATGTHDGGGSGGGSATHGADARTACVALGMYLFGIVYSPGEGPVPFTYSAEAYPLYVRSYGMALATATTWLFNGTLAMTWPSLVNALTPQGAFSWYAGWNVVGFVAILLFVRETKGKTLEELDQVFSVPMGVFARRAVNDAMRVVARVLRCGRPRGRNAKTGRIDKKEEERRRREAEETVDMELDALTPRSLEAR